jgi:phosphatidylserine decarboxylase
MKDGLIVNALSLIPKHGTARFMGGTARLRLPRFLHRVIVRVFAWRYRIDMNEFVGEVDDFDSLAAFFVRALKPGLRPVDADPGVLVSPVDGTVQSAGTIVDGRYRIDDDHDASVAELLGEAHPELPEFDAVRYEGGHVAILYLSPQDYHRVHSPCEGRVVAWRYSPGALWPVFPGALARVEGLLSRNERLTFLLQTAFGPVTEALIGAFGVGRMTSPLAPVTTNRGTPAVHGRPDAQIGRAEEIGRFELGSTVILLLEAGDFCWSIKAGDTVRLGREIGRKLP